MIEISFSDHSQKREGQNLLNNYKVSYKKNYRTFDFPSTGDEGRISSRKKSPSKRMSVILPAEVQLPSPGVEYTPHSPEQTDQLIASLSQSFYRHVSRCVLLLVYCSSTADYADAPLRCLGQQISYTF